MERERVLAAIPCYNEDVTIGSVVLKAKRHVDEVVVVDDGSIDDTKKVAEEAGAKVIKHNGNKGYGVAINSCFKYAKEHDFRAMVILDGDGQHNADEIPHILEPILKKEADISIGSRFLDGNNRKNIPAYRRVGIAVITWLTNFGARHPKGLMDGQSGFRGYSKRAIHTLNLKDKNMGVSAEILLQARKKKLSITEVSSSCRYDVNGSTYHPVRQGTSTIISILQYLEVQHSLLFFGIPGVALVIIGVALGFNVYAKMMDTGNLAIGMALVTAICLITGVLSGLTGLILHAVINASRRKWK